MVQVVYRTGVERSQYRQGNRPVSGCCPQEDRSPGSISACRQGAICDASDHFAGADAAAPVEPAARDRR